MSKLITLLVMVIFSGLSMASTTIYPTQVTLSKLHNVKTFTIRNNFEKSMAFNISVYLDKFPNQGKEINNSESILHKHITYSPRRSVLEPGEEQIIRVIGKNVEKLKDGDYTTYLKITPVSRIVKSKTTKVGSTSPKLTVITEMIIPVMLRKGNGVLTADITKAKVKKIDKTKSEMILDIGIENKGTYYVWGFMRMFGENKEGKFIQIAKDEKIKSVLRSNRSFDLTFKLRDAKYLSYKKIKVVLIRPKNKLVKEQKVNTAIVKF